MSELPSKYNPTDVEKHWYPLWESKGYFKPQSDKVGKKKMNEKYVIVIPPPNVTGILHMGHALNNSIQDVLVRTNRMKGKDTLWVPGVDHAGIATQNVVEKKLAKEQKSRHELGREAFLEEVWKWKEAHGSTITKQLRRLGASCDWSRERFTMDEGLSAAVRECFVSLYEEGLIYQGHYIINWCPRCQTALSDEEAAHKEIKGGLYHIKYPIVMEEKGGKGKKTEEKGKASALLSPSSSSFLPLPPLTKPGVDHIVVATTRPETMLGDMAVAVNPNDGRYKHLIGKKVILPLMEREIPIIADEFVDPDFGTGLVKVTPAHDPNDFEMGKRHKLYSVNVMHPDGTINVHGGQYVGMDRFAARKKIVADLEEQGLFVKRDTHTHAVGHCYRCDTIVEPYLSKQWFVKMKPLAEKALKAHKKGETEFIPERWTKVYTNWLEGIRDWCISRQIWWGHQIPVWYCEECKDGVTGRAGEREKETGIAASSADKTRRTPRNDDQGDPQRHCEGAERPKQPPSGVIVSRETPEKCPHCGNTDLTQDPDVLDTWFSSWLWPFSTLGWPPALSGADSHEPAAQRGRRPGGPEKLPEKGEPPTDLSHFYPTTHLVTAAEIIFFWVARMIMAGLHFMGKVPFSKIHIHGTVRAQSGLKMSKSLGNVIDPLEVIDEMGADALRFSLIMLSSQDVYLSREKFEVGRNFNNKLWNAARFVLMNLEGFAEGTADLKVKEEDRDISDKWILARLEQTTKQVDKHINRFGLSQASSDLYHFVWDDFCDWYLELAKPALTLGEESVKKNKQAILFFVLEKILRLAHPFIPFITEEIWQSLQEIAADKNNWPETIMLARWPYKEAWDYKNDEAVCKIVWLQQAVKAVRETRTTLQIPPKEKLEVAITAINESAEEAFDQFRTEISKLAGLKNLEVGRKIEHSKFFVTSVFSEFKVSVGVEGIVDPIKERERISKKIKEAEKYVKSLQGKLKNESFVKNAPEDVVNAEREKLEATEKVLRVQKELLAIFT